jgi:hypothetical protein
MPLGWSLTGLAGGSRVTLHGRHAGDDAVNFFPVAKLAAVALSMIETTCARADAYPERPTKFIVGLH